ncbi:Protein CBG12772 [Caenorhabditis briggsae]|uniref:Protein CBG12772 n=1 Tax=Caenorhabditis briggsae TaxID=6238 RepID=A8XGJ3_CAEBR|nr:Protein CBG12772 [Caenorhabditis briggsae]CAP31699.2 Protein CBG12772 [Caenorhabditis briggsae]
MKLQFLLLLFHVIVMSSEVVDVPDEVDIYDWVEDYFDELDKDSEIQHRRLGPDAEDTIPPNTSDKSANLFFASITKLISKNSAEDIDNLGTYSSDSTKILLCEEQKSVNFAGFRIYIRLLHHFFKDIQILKSGFRPHDYETSFEINYTAVSYENKAFNLKWKGDSEFAKNSEKSTKSSENRENEVQKITFFYITVVVVVGPSLTSISLPQLLLTNFLQLQDITKKVFYYTKFSLLGDCAGIPETLPEHPTQPIESYISRLKKTFSTEILATNPRPRPVDYDRFADDFLFKKVRVQLCEKNGEILSAAEFSKYLSDRYQTAVSFTDHAVSQNDFSNYQTVVIISVQADFPNGVIMRDNYTFRVEEKRNKGDELGWVDWWTAYVIVACPINLTPTVDPQALKDEFVGQVCGSLSPMINDEPSVESRTPFLSHMMKEEHQGFWAIICGTGNGPKNYSKLKSRSLNHYFSEQFLPSWPSSYASSELKKSEVLDNTNFSFKCILKLKKVDTTISKMDFQMRAYYELNQWLVKEVRVGCEY